MRKFLFILCLLALLPCARAQFGNFGDIPIEITADGNTRFEEGVAIAEDNVQIHYGKYSIFSDYAEYNPETRDIHTTTSLPPLSLSLFPSLPLSATTFPPSSSSGYRCVVVLAS